MDESRVHIIEEFNENVCLKLIYINGNYVTM